ncbi:hypothetical protein Q9S36_44045 [Microbacterium sp. ARD31]|nr:hypothetical protein [Microbacterium sp. ARD31]MDT0187179.1 hypothetical protein [Microbacterium sp. ARD31]
MTTPAAFGSTALTSLVALSLTELYVELLAGAAAWAVGWWLLREPAPDA